MKTDYTDKSITEIIQEARKDVPDMWIASIKKNQVNKITDELVKKYQLSEENNIVFKRELLMSLYFIVPPRAFPQNLKENSDIEKETFNELVNEVISRIFKPLYKSVQNKIKNAFEEIGDLDTPKALQEDTDISTEFELPSEEAQKMDKLAEKRTAITIKLDRLQAALEDLDTNSKSKNSSGDFNEKKEEIKNEVDKTRDHLEKLLDEIDNAREKMEKYDDESSKKDSKKFSTSSIPAPAPPQKSATRYLSDPDPYREEADDE